MKASLTWMKDYVPVDTTKPAQDLADVLTQAGIPVEDVIDGSRVEKDFYR